MFGLCPSVGSDLESRSEVPASRYIGSTRNSNEQELILEMQSGPLEQKLEDMPVVEQPILSFVLGISVER